MRNLSQHQDKARQATEWFVVLLLLGSTATILISAVCVAVLLTAGTVAVLKQTTFEITTDYIRSVFLDRFTEALIFMAAMVIGTAAYRSWKIAEGGGSYIAGQAGGTRIVNKSIEENPLCQKVLNVVEELSIALAVRRPRVYLLDDEEGINAFAAGSSAKDAVITVTRGAISQLTRSQLQGVIAHEFSHIINGDMRLNSRLLGALGGIEAISQLADFLRHSGRVGKRKTPTYGGGNGLLRVLGLLLTPVGMIGGYFALVVKLAINRQREFLADASAVAITGDPHGLADALKIIGGYAAGSKVTNRTTQRFGFMFFSAGEDNVASLFSTHPPLVERIRRLDPNWNALTTPQHPAAADKSQNLSYEQIAQT